MCKRLGLFTVIFVLMFSAIPLTMAESDCDFTYSNHARGAQLYAMGDLSRALRHYECALEQRPDSDILRLSIGDIYRDMGDMTTANKYYNQITAYDTTTRLADTSCDFSFSNQARGEQFFSMQSFTGALYHFKCALEQDPNNVALLQMIGDIYQYRGDRANAFVYYERANQVAATLIEDTCETDVSHFANGSQLHDMGDRTRALEAYQCALKQNPDRIAILFQMIQVYLETAQYDNAMMYLNRAIQLDDDNALLYDRRGYALYMNGDLDRALIDLNVALELHPNLQSALETRNRVLEALGQTEILSVESPISKNALPQLDSDLSNTSLTMTVAEAAPNSSTADVLRKAADNFFNSYKFERAITQYETLLAFEPDNAFAHYRLGYAYYALENPSQALIYLKQAEALNPDHLYTQYFLAMSYSMLGMRQDALTTMSNIYEAYPYDGAFPIAMGHVYRNLGHNESAAAEFNLWLEQHELLHLDTTSVSDNTPLTIVMDYGVVYDMPFYAVKGDSIDITAQSSVLNRTPVDSLIVVLNADGVPIAGDDDSGELFDAQLTFTPPTTGHYTLLVSHAGGNSSGEVKVKVSGIAQSADMYRTLAQAAMDEGHYYRALEMLDQAITMDGGIYEDYVMRARAYFQLEDYHNTINAYYRAIELTSEPGNIYAEIGRIYRMMEDWDSAALAYSQALEADPMLDYARCQLGMIYAMWGDYDEALNQYEIIMIHNQSDSCAWSNHRATIRLMSHTGLLDEMNASTAPREPSRADDLVALGNLYLEQGKKFSAAHTFLDALRLDPTLDQVRCDLGLIYSSWGNYGSALAQYDQVKSNPCAEENRAITTAQTEALYAAIQSTWYTNTTMTAQDYVDMAEAHKAKQEWNAAFADYQQALELDPTRTDVQCELNKLTYHEFQGYDNGMSHFDTMLGNNLDNDCSLNHQTDASTIQNEADTLYDIAISMGTDALFYEAETRRENGEGWLAIALIDRYIDENLATTCAGKLRWLSDKYHAQGFTAVADLLELKAIDTTC
jgi:tetratricopeptide (TPR) repeat protein